MATTFPAELTDRIIDFLHSDKRALSACSLVCKAWIPASRYHLFRELTITFPKAQYLFELFRSTTTKDDNGASGEPSPSISNMQRQMPRESEVFNYVQSVSWSLNTYIDNKEAFTDSVMQIIASFPRLSEFSMGNFRHHYLRYLRNIKKFSDHSSEYPIAGTKIVFANNPGLECLDIWSKRWGVLVSPQLHLLFADMPPNSPPLKLRHLSATGFLFRPENGSIMSHFRSLTSLEWLERPGKTMGPSAELWQTLKSENIRLSRLKTSLVHDSLLEYLSSFQGMKDLHLVRIIGKDDEDSDRLARTLFQVVCQHHADTLETLHINSCDKGDWCFVHHDITPILSCTNLRELGTCVYWLDNFGYPDATPVFHLLNSTCKLPSLRLLRIFALKVAGKVVDSVAFFETIHAIRSFDPRIGDGAIRIPVPNVHVGFRRFEWQEGKYSCTSDS